MSTLEEQLEAEHGGRSGAKSQANPYGRKRYEAPGTEELLANMGGKVPWSNEAEKGLLSSVMQYPDLLPDMVRKVKDDFFYSDANRTVWMELVKMYQEGKPVDVVLLTDRLRVAEKLERVGGPAYPTELFSFVPVPSHAVHYQKILTDNWLLRRMLHESASLVHETQNYGAAGEDTDVVAFVTAAESRMFKLVEDAQAQGESGEEMKDAKVSVAEWVDHMQRTIDNRGKIMGLTTGIHEIDQTLHGMDDSEGEILTVAGRPAMGKTALGCTLVNHLAVERRIPGLVFSIEMSANQLMTRIVLGGAGIDTAKAITGHFSRGDFDAMHQRTREVQTSPLLMCTSAATSTADLRAQTLMAKRRYGIRWILVDHLHLVKSANPRQNDERLRLVEVMETLQYLKKELKLVVILLVQMNRDSDKNPGKPPVLADLSGSAAIEQYSDHVLFIHRDNAYTPWQRLNEDRQNEWRRQIDPRRERSPELWSDGLKYDDESGGYARQDYEEKAMIFVRKNRRGPTPELQVRYQGELTRFSTRMPRLNSTNPLDWQMGTYSTGSGGGGGGSYTKRGPKIKKASEASPDMNEVFPDGND